jgi:CRP-like cAMP-binding protein
VVPIHALHALIDCDQRFARAMIANLSEHLHGLVAELEATSLHSGLQRLAAYLDSLAGLGDAQPCVHLPATKTIIAAHLGITKETLSRLLRDLMRRGLVAVAKRDVTLLDRAQISALIRGSGAAEERSAATSRGERMRQDLALDMRQRNGNAIG